jgi:Flp pilus assembly pilin Flp
MLLGVTAKPNPRAARRGLLVDVRGAAMTEYVVLVGTVGLAIVAALVLVGPKLVKDYERSRNIVTSPMP